MDDLINFPTYTTLIIELKNLEIAKKISWLMDKQLDETLVLMSSEYFWPVTVEKFQFFDYFWNLAIF